MIDKLLMSLRARGDVPTDVEAALRVSCGEVMQAPAHRTVIEQDVPLDHSIVLLDGLFARYKDMRSGQRQITHIHVPGDFADLHSYTLKRLDHNVMAMTACRYVRIAHSRLTEITERFPALARVFWRSTNVDASIHREWIVSLGRRNATCRTAHLLCELQMRLEVVGLAEPDGYALSITQADLAECVGLTPVHINRVIRDLREARLADFRGGSVSILDLEGLRRLADFDPLYLHYRNDTLTG